MNTELQKLQLRIKNLKKRKKKNCSMSWRF